MLQLIKNAVYTFTYTNYKGETSLRKVIFVEVTWGQTKYHPEDQWLFSGVDLLKGEGRIFAMKDMSNLSLSS